MAFQSILRPSYWKTKWEPLLILWELLLNYVENTPNFFQRNNDYIFWYTKDTIYDYKLFSHLSQKCFIKKIKYNRLACLFYASDPYDYYTILCWHMWEHAIVTKNIFWCKNINIFLGPRLILNNKLVRKMSIFCTIHKMVSFN